MSNVILAENTLAYRIKIVEWQCNYINSDVKLGQILAENNY